MTVDPEGLARLAEGPEGADKEGAMMAAMQEFAEKGNQIFITLVKGREYPPTTVDVRCGYNQTIQELREKLETAAGARWTSSCCSTNTGRCGRKWIAKRFWSSTSTPASHSRGMTCESPLSSSRP